MRLFVAPFAPIFALLLALFAPSAFADDIPLADNWRIANSQDLKADGATISSAKFDSSSWHPASVPTTVLNALVKDGTYKDVFVGKNLDAIPTEPFTHPWWYRTEFDLEERDQRHSATLTFDGINYRANIFLNGKQIASADKTWGAYRTFHLDVHLLKHNVLAVEVTPPQKGDYTLGFVDWNPITPDHEMGLFRPVHFHLYNTVELSNLAVESKIDHATWTKADLIVRADAHNNSGSDLDTIITATIDGVETQETVSIKAHDTIHVSLTADKHPTLHLDQAKLWYPWELGEPTLYTMNMTAGNKANIVDSQTLRFGIRETTDYLTPEGYRGYMINGKKILIRGGGWVDDLLLDENPTKLAAQIQYVKDMNLNTIRCEGFWGESQKLYDLCDENGILVMPGFSCQWEWVDYLGKKVDSEEYGGFQTPDEQNLAADYLTSQVLWLRSHPSIFVWVLGSDKMPQTELENRYAALLKDIDPTRPQLMSCHENTSKVTGSVAVKMDGPYDYVTPNYWYEDTTHGGAYGFNTETGPGPQPPPLDSLAKMIPADKLWPMNDVWEFHCGRNEFNTMKRYMNAFNNRYGEAKSVDEFAYKSQAANYEAIRAMFEAFSVNRAKTTGIIQWMLNASWPKMYWQCYDYYLNPGGSYFGTKKGAAPLAIIYNYADHGIYVSNQIQSDLSATATVTVYDANSKVIFTSPYPVSMAENAVQKISELKIESPTPVYFIDLRLADSAGKTLASNFYWLSTKPDVLDEAKSEWFVTPNKSFADFTALSTLPESTVHAMLYLDGPNLKDNAAKGGDTAKVSLVNNSDQIAFFIEMRLIDPKTKQNLLPVIWEDNYISLPPHAIRDITVKLPQPHPLYPQLQLRGWNSKVESATIAN